MRTTGRRSFVIYIFLVLFVTAACILLFQFVTRGSKWAMQPFNGHLSLIELGTIYDRDGNVLAETVDGKRTYSESEAARIAMLHTVGDNKNNVVTSVQSALHGKLRGYNLLTGVNNVLQDKGKDVTLTVSRDVSIAAYNALGNQKGAVIVYNYQNGNILTNVSTPSFDPQNVPGDIAENPAYEGAYLNRNFSVVYPPGSTFKIVTQAAAIDAFPDWSERTYRCDGSIKIGENNVTCMGVHGTIDAKTAMKTSCNIYYALLANDIGAKNLEKKAVQFGFNSEIAFDNITCRKSSINISGANENQLAWAGIGQYTTLANPCHMLTLMGAIASGGNPATPRLIESISLTDIFSNQLPSVGAEEAAKLRTLMRNNVQNYYGDNLFPAGMEVCAKSGTAEIGDEKKPTCWLVGFSSNHSTPYAFVVVVEEGESGTGTAGQVASKVMFAVSEYVK